MYICEYNIISNKEVYVPRVPFLSYIGVSLTKAPSVNNLLAFCTCIKHSFHATLWSKTKTISK